MMIYIYSAREEVIEELIFYVNRLLSDTFQNISWSHSQLYFLCVCDS